MPVRHLVEPVAGGACTGLGIRPTRIDGVLGVTKAYLTRVGAGPFPTEAGDGAARRSASAATSAAPWPAAPRCGWLDAVGLRYAGRVNGLTGWRVTKLDVLSGSTRFRCARGRVPTAR